MICSTGEPFCGCRLPKCFSTAARANCAAATAASFSASAAVSSGPRSGDREKRLALVPAERKGLRLRAFLKIIVAEAPDLFAAVAELLRRRGGGEQLPGGVAARIEVEPPVAERGIVDLLRIEMEDVDVQLDPGSRQVGRRLFAVERAYRFFPFGLVAVEVAGDRLELAQLARRRRQQFFDRRFGAGGRGRLGRHRLRGQGREEKEREHFLLDLHAARIPELETPVAHRVGGNAKSDKNARSEVERYDRYVLDFSEIDRARVALVGGKGAHLGELSRIDGRRGAALASA